MKFCDLLEKFDDDTTLHVMIPIDTYPKDYAIFELYFDEGKMGLMRNAKWFRKYMNREEILNMEVVKIKSGHYDIILIYLVEV